MSETKSKIADASRALIEIEDELEEAHGEPVTELPSMRVYADSHGHELNEITKWMNDVYGIEVDRSDVSEWMHEQARGVDYDWSVSDPVVVLTD